VTLLLIFLPYFPLSLPLFDQQLWSYMVKDLTFEAGMRRFSLLLRRRPVLIGSLVGTMGLMFGFWRQASPSGGPKHSKLTLTGPELRSLGRASLWRTSTPPSQGRRSISPTEVTKYEAAVGGPAFIENKGQWPGSSCICAGWVA